MAWHRHRVKRAKQNKKSNTRNVSAKRALKVLTKKLLTLIKEKKVEEAKTQLEKLTKAYATSAKRGIVHHKNASRHISRLTIKVNKIGKEDISE